MSTITSQLVDVSGESGAISINQGGTVLITVRNTLVDGGLAVSTVQYRAALDQSWEALDDFDSADGDYLKFNAPAGEYRVSTEIDVSVVDSHATVDFVLIGADASAEKSCMLVTLAEAQTEHLTPADHFKYANVKYQRGANIILDTVSPYNVETWDFSSVGVFKLRPGRSYLLEASAGSAIFSAAGYYGAVFADLNWDQLDSAALLIDPTGIVGTTSNAVRVVLTPADPTVIHKIVGQLNLTSVGASAFGMDGFPILRITEL